MNLTSKASPTINPTEPKTALNERLTMTQTELAANHTTDEQAAPYSETYFDALYHNNTDPWQYQTRWYEKRKRDICLAVLPQQHYNNAIELGCGNGVFTELLAHRCHTQVSIDGNAHAVRLAKQRVAALRHVRVLQGVIPNVLWNLPSALIQANPLSSDTLASKPVFDLIVISEILYYLSLEDIDIVIDWIKKHLAPNGTLLCCHWRYAIDGFKMNGELVHQRLQQAFDKVANHNEDYQAPFHHQTKISDSDFLLDVWQRTSASIARQENLI